MGERNHPAPLRLDKVPLPVVSPEHCARLCGGSVRDCVCMLPNGAGWAECPEEARGILVPADPPACVTVWYPEQKPAYSGDVCHTCGGPNMIRTGTCLTCSDCGDSSGGCS